MPYTPINWKDFPNGETPLSATNFNKMDQQIKENTERLDNFNPDLPDNVALYKEEHSTTEPIPRDADLLDGHPASYYATQAETNEIKDILTKKKRVYIELADLGIATPTTIYDILAKMEFGSQIVANVARTDVTDLPAAGGTLYITKASTNSTLQKSIIQLYTASQAATTLVNTIYYGYVNYSSHASSWYRPTLTQV